MLVLLSLTNLHSKDLLKTSLISNLRDENEAKTMFPGSYGKKILESIVLQHVTPSARVPQVIVPGTQKRNSGAPERRTDEPTDTEVRSRKTCCIQYQ